LPPPKPAKPITVTLDGKPIALKPAPVVVAGGYLMVAAEAATKAVGAVCVIAKDHKSATITRGKAKVALKLGEASAVMNGHVMPLPTAPILRDGLCYFPARAVMAALGITLKWDPATRVVALTTRKP